MIINDFNVYWAFLRPTEAKA